ncbi:MAG: sulfurtransferase-like selenium metabolism protein YedF [Lachnospiraceae bacterium]|nr:sulfurtransferase-like selenium metabolism protein YedF [Lachnospiraceae bacterium]
MVKVNGMGKNCPIPLIETKKAIKALTSPDTVEVMVDNNMAVKNITRFATDSGYVVSTEKISEKEFKLTIEVKEIKPESEGKALESCAACGATDNTGNIVIAIGSEKMGCGDEKLGKNLMKAFLYSVSQAEVRPKTILFFNGGAHLTCEGSLSLEDLNNLKELGVDIKTCGTCLDFYGLKDKLKVGDVTNMYDIVSTMESASLVIRP